MSERTNEHRLPPPAFPPGHRRHVHHNNSAFLMRQMPVTPNDFKSLRNFATVGICVVYLRLNIVVGQT